MNPTVPFFAKLKKLAVTLESETVQLQRDFEHRNNDDSEADGQQSEAAGEESEDNEAGEEEEEGESQEEAGDSPSSSPQTAKPPAFTDVMRTPQPSDFGLSETLMKEMLAGCSEVPPMPEMSQPHPSLYEPASPPPMPFTLKCALRMDDEDLRTPQPSDFGLSETLLKEMLAGCSEVPPMPEKFSKLSAVSESEFQSLPKYLRQMTLHNLNQVVEHINTFTAESEGEHTVFQMEELWRICTVGTKTPIFILCLTELKRLKHIGGHRNTAVYKLYTQT